MIRLKALKISSIPPVSWVEREEELLNKLSYSSFFSGEVIHGLFYYSDTIWIEHSWIEDNFGDIWDLTMYLKDSQVHKEPKLISSSDTRYVSQRFYLNYSELEAKYQRVFDGEG